MGAIFVGIEIGGSKIQIACGTGAGEIVHRKRMTVDVSRGGVGIRERLECSLREMLASMPRLVGIGVGFGGPINWRNGIIECSHQIEGWAGFDLGGWLGSITQTQVRVDNDANVGALGEALHGAGKGFNPVFYITLGSGVGGGLVANRHIYHGASPGEAEIGHVRLDRQGATVESRCSGWAVDARIRRLKTESPDSLLCGLIGQTEGGEAKHLRTACEQGDPAACQILRETAEDVAFGLSHAVHLFHPEMIVLGGGLALVGEPLRAAVENALGRFVMDAFRPGPRLSLAGLGEDAIPVGALELARAGCDAAAG